MAKPRAVSVLATKCAAIMRILSLSPKSVLSLSWPGALSNHPSARSRDPEKRGEGMTKKSHSATLVALKADGNELIANKPNPVAKAVVELMGLDVKQFRQVMVLPQGKFREL